MQRSIVTTTLRSTIRWTLVPAAILYTISLVWSSAEGIDLQLVAVSYTHLTLPTKA